ncbi:MAG: sigma-54 dependent transcriptional regulator [bacterium]|nr:sigma-54 dependent transcriptional regulator [bacterium]
MPVDFAWTHGNGGDVSRILVIDDHETMQSGVVLAMTRMGNEAFGVGSGAEGMEKLGEQAFDLVITDYKMDAMDGLAVLEAVQKTYPDTDVMLMTAYGTIEIAVQAMKAGAVDFIAKPFPPEMLQVKVESILKYRKIRNEHQQLGEENRYLRAEIEGRFNFGELVGSSAKMAQVYNTVRKVAATDSAVMVYGESGTGKELVARAIHKESGRHNAPFVKVNCGALPKELAGSELFGHEKGAFTGAVRQKKGKFELAEGGTIFLDEIGDLPLEVQVNLLRVLQEKEFDRVGGEHPVRVDVRVVAATHRSLKKMVEEGRFREDLFYRLEVIPIFVPPLRERKGDISELVEHFLHKKSGEMNRPVKQITPSAMTSLMGYRWPGNVRELENAVERMVVLSEGAEIDWVDLPFEEGQESDLQEDGPLTQQMEALEKRLIRQALAEAEGVKTRAASLLGVKTSALYYKLEKYGLGDGETEEAS